MQNKTSLSRFILPGSLCAQRSLPVWEVLRDISNLDLLVELGKKSQDHKE